jgi:hypothetical protein
MTSSGSAAVDRRATNLTGQPRAPVRIDNPTQDPIRVQYPVSGERTDQSRSSTTEALPKKRAVETTRGSLRCPPPMITIAALHDASPIPPWSQESIMRITNSPISGYRQDLRACRAQRGSFEALTHRVPVSTAGTRLNRSLPSLGFSGLSRPLDRTDGSYWPGP